MVMSSLEFKQLCVAFAADLQEIDEDLFSAIEGDVSKSGILSSIAAGEKKIEDYEALLGRLDEFKKSQVVENYGESMGDIRDALKNLKERDA